MDLMVTLVAGGEALANGMTVFWQYSRVMASEFIMPLVQFVIATSDGYFALDSLPMVAAL